MREVIELSNIAKLYLKEKIKQECWDSMEVQGKVIMVSVIKWLFVIIDCLFCCLVGI